MSQPRWATRSEAAQHIGVHANTIARWATEGRIREHHFGPRLVRYDLNEIDAMSSTNHQKVSHGTVIDGG